MISTSILQDMTVRVVPEGTIAAPAPAPAAAAESDGPTKPPAAATADGHDHLLHGLTDKGLVGNFVEFWRSLLYPVDEPAVSSGAA